MTPFYVVLEARRQAGSHIGVGQVLLAADSAIPDRSATLAELFMRRTGAALEFFSSSRGSVPSDAFDYRVEDGGGSHTLFSVRPVLPDQGAFKLELEAAGGRRTTWLMLGALAFLVTCGPASARWLGVVAATLLLVVTPAGNWMGLGQLFSAAAYYLDLLGPVSASAGSLMVTSALGLVALVPIARRGIRRRGIGIAVAVALVLAFPFTIEYLASGVTPPTSGLPISTVERRLEGVDVVVRA